MLGAAQAGVVRIVRESVGRGAGDSRTPVHPAVVLLPAATAVETYALEELPAGDVVLHLLLYAAGRVAGEFSRSPSLDLFFRCVVLMVKRLF